MYHSINQIKERNKYLGHHFFDASAMRFFDSRVGRKLYRGHYFISSEQFHSGSYSGRRKYSLRMALDNGQIETLYSFNTFTSRDTVVAYIEALPEQFPLAYKLAVDSFNNGNYEEFLHHARISKDHNEPAEQRLNSFTGACYWLIDNYKELDLSWAEIYNSKLFN